MKNVAKIGAGVGVLMVVGVFAWQRQKSPVPPHESSEELENRLSQMMEAAKSSPAPILKARIEKTAVTALENFKGYDLRLNISIECVGEPPEWWGQMGSRETVERGHLVAGSVTLPRRPLCRTSDFRRYKDPKMPYEAFYLVNLKGCRGPLVLRDDLPLFFGRTPIPGTVVKIETPLLAAGETAKPPKISHEPGAKIEKITLEKVRLDEDESNVADAAKISVSYRRIDKSGARGVKLRVFDQFGKEWPIKPQFDTSSVFSISAGDTDGSAFTLFLDSIPRSVGKLMVRGYVYCGDKWPAPFSLPLRDAEGEIIEKRVPALKFTVLKTVIIATEGGTIDAGVLVKGAGNAKKLREVNWTSNPYPSLVEALGRVTSLSPDETGIGIGVESGDRVRLSWMLDKKLFPNGSRGMTFKTWIRADGGPQVPVSIPLS